MMDKLCAFALERENVRIRKERGDTPPWTKDETLQKYRFCNVRREDDAVTRWINDNWRLDVEHIWFYMLVARIFNKPTTLQQLPSPLRGYTQQSYQRVLDKIPSPFGVAYLVTTNGIKIPKLESVIERTLTPAWKRRAEISKIMQENSLERLGEKLLTLWGVSGFMAGQVLADVKNCKSLRFATDWETFAYSGPGSRRGLNRLVGNPKDAPWKESLWKSTLLVKRDLFNARTGLDLCAQDFQNCLCEFDKYVRHISGEGRPKQLYRSAK